MLSYCSEKTVKANAFVYVFDPVYRAALQLAWIIRNELALLDLHAVMHLF